MLVLPCNTEIVVNKFLIEGKEKKKKEARQINSKVMMNKHFLLPFYFENVNFR